MPLLFRKKGLAAKIESTYATDPTIDEGVDSIQHANLDVQPLEGEFINRNLDRATLGAEGDILVASRVPMSFLVEAAGSGAAGTAPAYDALLRGCGLTPTTVASTSVTYDPVSASFESLWMEANYDGNQHIGKGARGSFGFQWATRGIPAFNFAFQGLYQAPSAAALPTYDLSAFTVPEAFNNANTPTASLHGVDLALESISLDLQNQIEHIDVIGNEEIIIVDRNVRGSVVFQAPLISTKDWFASVAARTAGALSIVHGDTAGNILTVSAPSVEVSNPRYSESRGIKMLTLDIICLPQNGDDEIAFAFT